MSIKANQKGSVYLVVPEEFLDVEGDTWHSRGRDGEIEVMTLPQVLLHTLRRCPVKTGEDAERTLDIGNIIRACDGYIEFPQADWDWMMGHLREFAHTVWAAPDSAYLRRYLDASKQVSVPTVSD